MLRHIFAAVLLLVAGVGAAADLSAQEPMARERLRDGMEAAARGDTIHALAILDEVLSLQPDLAEAHYRQAQLYVGMASGRSSRFEERVKAHAALEEALRHDPGNPLYMVELGKLMLMQRIRIDARRMFERALQAAFRADATTLAEVHFQLGVFHETQWLRFKDRHLLPMGREQIDADVAVDDSRYTWEFINRASYPGPDQGGSDRDAMLGHFRAALNADASHASAAAHLIGYFHDEGLYEQLLEVARGAVVAAPSEPRSYLGLGLGLYRSGDFEGAAGAFHYAVSIMSDRERREVENVGRIIDRRAEDGFRALTQPQRDEYQRRFWAFSDPLLLSESNEFWLEYMARMAYVDFRYGVPEYRLRGWETDRGIIYLRYGPPAKVVTFGARTSRTQDISALGTITTVWSYGERGPSFIFRQNPGYRNATFANDFRFYAEDYRSIQPARLTSPLLPERSPLPVQVVRFRSPEGRMDIEVHGLIPVGQLAGEAPVAETTLETGLFIQDEQAREVSREVAATSVPTGEANRLQSWRVTVVAGESYMVGVEAREPASWRAAVGRERVTPRQFPAGQLSVSDLLMGNRVEPLTAEPSLRSDFRVEPNPAMTYAPGQPVELYFELYNLLPDEDHYASYEVDLAVTIEEIERTGPAVARILGELADRWGFTPEGTSPAELRFDKQARVLARDAVPEYFRIELPGAPPGRYSLRLQVRDRNSGMEAVTERTFHVREESGER